MTLPAEAAPPPQPVEAINAAAQSCAGAWQEMTGLGDLLASGRILDAWSSISGAAGSCWNTLGDMMGSVLPFLA